MRYRVYGYMTVGCWTYVEADNEADAIAIAQDREPAQLTVGALRPDDDECFHFENDGAPLDLKAEEA